MSVMGEFITNDIKVNDNDESLIALKSFLLYDTQQVALLDNEAFAMD